jgi:hypothetical protein
MQFNEAGGSRHQLSAVLQGERDALQCDSRRGQMCEVQYANPCIYVLQNPVSPLNWVGSALAILGTYLYSLASQKAKTA